MEVLPAYPLRQQGLSAIAMTAIGRDVEAGSCGGRKSRHHPQQTPTLGYAIIAMF